MSKQYTLQINNKMLHSKHFDKKNRHKTALVRICIVAVFIFLINL
jgi:hypothetical protein